MIPESLKQARTPQAFLQEALYNYPTIETEDGDTYTGTLNNKGLRHGYGLVIFKEGGFYIGEWQDDFAQGQGLHVEHDNTVSEGKWKHNMLHGKAKLTHPD